MPREIACEKFGLRQKKNKNKWLRTIAEVLGFRSKKKA